MTNSKNIKMTNSCFQVSLQHLSYISIMYIVVATYKISILETFSYKLETKRHFFGRDSPFCYMIVKQQDLDKITSQKNFTFRSWIFLNCPCGRTFLLFFLHVKVFYRGEKRMRCLLVLQNTVDLYKDGQK